MGIKIREIREVTCDACGAECGERDGDIAVPLPGAGLPEKRPTLRGGLRYYDPGTAIESIHHGVVCRDCLLKGLRAFLDKESLPDVNKIRADGILLVIRQLLQQRAFLERDERDTSALDVAIEKARREADHLLEDGHG